MYLWSGTALPHELCARVPPPSHHVKNELLPEKLVTFQIPQTIREERIAPWEVGDFLDSLDDTFRFKFLLF